MKKNFFFLALLFIGYFLMLGDTYGQVPEGINYQGVLRDNLGSPLNNISVNVKFTIRQSSPAGTAIFLETHSTATDQFGLINLKLGEINDSAFTAINWGVGGPHYLQVEVDEGTGFVDLGSSQLLSVPFAMYARSSSSGAPGFNSIIDTSDAGIACDNGGFRVSFGLDTNANSILEVSEVNGSFVVCNGAPGLSLNWLGSFVIPPNGNENDMYYNSTHGVSYIFNGVTSSWDTLVAGVAGGGNDNDWVIAGVNMSSGLAGNVGIGTFTPNKKLSIQSASLGGDGIQINNVSNTGDPGIEYQTQGVTRYVMGIDQSDANKFKIGTVGVNIGTSVTINDQGLMGLGTSTPTRQLTVESSDSLIARFSSPSPNYAAISVVATDPNAPAGMVVLSGVDTGIVGLDENRVFSISNTAIGGHTVVHADSSVSLRGEIVGNIANTKIVHQADTIYTTDTVGGNVININDGTFFTDSLYLLGANSTNFGWLLANNGAGQAVWTNPSIISGGAWTSNGSSTVLNSINDNVGIGTNTPLQHLTISKPGTVILRMERSNASAFDWEMIADNLGYHIKGGANATGNGLTDFLTIDGNGKVGMGTTTPGTELEIYSDTPELRIYSSRTNSLANAYIRFGDQSGGGFTQRGWVGVPGSGDYLELGSPNAIFFNTNFSSRMIINSDGKVGIGTSSPSDMLHIRGGTILIDDGSNPYKLPFSDGTVGAVMVSDGAGNASWKERKIAFEASATSPITVSDTIFTGTGNLIFDAVHLNDGGGFDFSAGHFEAPVSGVYAIDANITFEYFTTGQTRNVQLGLFINGTATPYNVSSRTLNNHEKESISISVTLHLAAGDKIHLEAISEPSTSISIVAEPYNWVSGHLIYAE